MSNIPWTEAELEREIAKLDRMILEAARGDDERSRSVLAFLKQLRQDRRDALAVLRRRRLHPQ